jgi:alpha-1,6-mannosyltransferase
MERSTSRRVEPPLVAAIAGVLFVGVVASIQGSPLQPVQPRGVTPFSPLHFAARVFGLQSLGSTAQAVLAIVAMVAATATFLYALWAAWRGELGLRLVTWVGVAFVVFAVSLPLLFSRDVYAYATYGRIASIHHANPYLSTPHDFVHDPMYRLVGREWRNTTAVYGPAFTLLSSGLTAWLHGPVALIWAYKVIAGAAAVATLLLVTALSRRLWPSRAAFAAVLIGWNPIVLFHAVGGGHNDMLVGLAVAAAFWVLAGGRAANAADGPTTRAPSTGRELGATTVLALATLVKATAAIPLALVIAAAVARRPRGTRLRGLASHVALVVAIAAVFVAPFFQLHDLTFGLTSLAAHEGWLAPTRFFRVVFGHIAHAAAGNDGKAVIQGIVRVVIPVVFAVGFLAVLLDLVRRARVAPLDAPSQVAAWGWALLLALLCAPVLWPWYVVWVLPIAWVLPRTPRLSTVALSAALSVSQTVAAAVLFPTIFRGTLFVGHYVLTPVLIVVLVLLLRELRDRLRSGVGLLAELPSTTQEHREVAHAGHQA